MQPFTQIDHSASQTSFFLVISYYLYDRQGRRRFLNFGVFLSFPFNILLFMSPRRKCFHWEEIIMQQRKGFILPFPSQHMASFKSIGLYTFLPFTSCLSTAPYLVPTTVLLFCFCLVLSLDSTDGRKHTVLSLMMSV